MNSSKRARRRTASRARIGTALALLTLVTLAPTFAGCGGGGGSSGGRAPLSHPLSISTRTLPAAGQDSPYELALAADGGAPPYAWSLAPGSGLPPGLTLSGAGQLYGVPRTLGAYPFTALVRDAAAPAARASASFTLEVTAFHATIEGVRYGAAWTGASYVVRATGTASTTFWFVENATGATLTAGSALENAATYVAGPHAGTDTISVRDASGTSIVLHVLVVENPVANLSARFGATDVWFLRFEGKLDASHAFDSDWHAALATAGLRAPAGSDATGTMADDLADLYVRRRVLRELNVLYGNGADGTPAPSGLAISFPLEEPTPPYVAPADGTVTAPAGNRYNVVSMIHGTDPSHFGTALQDSPFNTTQENDTTRGPGADEYGIFVNQVASFFVLTYHDEILPAAPIGDADVPVLLSLLYGHPDLADRTLEIERILDGFARSIAALAAHEIGHSVGLGHTSPAVDGSIMNAYSRIDPGATYAFVPSDRASLARALPGPGRGLSALSLESAWVSGAGDGTAPALETPDCRLEPAR